MKNDTESLDYLLTGKQIHCPTNKNSLSRIEVLDLSLYQNCIMVRDRIWGPQSLKLNFFNNLHLGNRGLNMMMKLAQRSVYWSGMAQDLEDYFNESETCNRHMDKN